jgi:GNAT superfamily N-acetyltransferase
MKTRTFTPGSREIDLFVRETPGGRKFEVTHNGEDIAYAYAQPNTVEVDGRKIDTLLMQKIEVEEPWRRKGVSTYLMERMAWNAEREGRALQSDWIRSEEHDPFWQKQLRKGRIAHTLTLPGGATSYLLPLPAPDSLSGLPKKGRIPLATVKRAAARLPKWTRKCGFTVAQLREGMEVEREHRDVTRGGVLKTAKIAAAHLCEFPKGGYYPGLKRLEKKLKGKKR